MSGSDKIESLSEDAFDPWEVIQASFGQWGPNGQRVMLTRLFDWYHAQPASTVS